MNWRALVAELTKRRGTAFCAMMLKTGFENAQSEPDQDHVAAHISLCGGHVEPAQQVQGRLTVVMPARPWIRCRRGLDSHLLDPR